MANIKGKLAVLSKSLHLYGIRNTALFTWNFFLYQFFKRVLGKKTVRRRIDGFDIVLDLRTHGISKTLFQYEERERDQLHLFRQFLNPGDTVLELGANIGYYLLHQAACIAPNGHILAVEPDPRSFSLLRENVTLNQLDHRVQLHETALSNSDGWLRFGLASEANLSRLLAPNEPTDAFETVRDVPVADTGRFLEEHGGATSLRMDIEGGEVEVLMSLIRLFDRAPTCCPSKLFFEVHPQYYSHGRDMPAVLTQLFQRGFHARAATSQHAEATARITASGYTAEKTLLTQFKKRSIFGPLQDHDTLTLTMTPDTIRILYLEKSNHA